LKVNPDMFLFKILGTWDISKFFNPSIFTIVPSNKVFVNNFNPFWSSLGPTRFFRINQIDEKIIVSFIEILTPSFTPIKGPKSFGQPWSNSFKFWSSVPVHDNSNFRTWPNQVTILRHLLSIWAHKLWFQFSRRQIWWTFAYFALFLHQSLYHFPQFLPHFQAKHRFM